MSTRAPTPVSAGVPRPFAEMAGGVAIIDHHQRAVTFGEIADRRQVGHMAIHRKDAVGRDQPEARAVAIRFLQPVFSSLISPLEKR